RVTMGTPWSTALRPPTTTNSTWASASRTIISLAKCCIAQGLLDEQPPPFVEVEPLRGGQPQHEIHLGEIEVFPVFEIERGWVRRVPRVGRHALLRGPPLLLYALARGWGSGSGSALPTISRIVSATPGEAFAVKWG